MAEYHEGERAVQERAGLRAESARLEPAIRATIPDAAAEFLAAQPMLALSARDGAGRLWGTLLTGRPGFVRAVGPSRVLVDARPPAGDPLADVLAAPARVGTIAIEPDRRRRMRLNGTARPHGPGLAIDADQVYSNCPKYIQRRTASTGPGRAPGPARRGVALTPAQRALLSRTDTFFLATADADGNCDMSHRGGNPGFVRVESDRRLRFPDYVGNAMFMTLGNLAVNPSAGLLVPDWSTGDLLHLTGTAHVVWDAAEVAAVPGAQRLVDFDITAVIARAGASPLRWSAPEYSRFNPAVGR